jgi:hypothetical protein
MHERLVSLFFPHGAPSGLEASDPERSAEAALSAAASTADDEAGAELRRAVAQQLLSREPPEMETAAVRMLEAGRPPAVVWRELEMASLDAVLGDRSPGEDEAAEGAGVASELETGQRLTANLALLPLPSYADVFDTYLELAPRPTPVDDLDRAVAARLGIDLGVPMLRNYVESVQDEVIRSEALALIGDDLAVDPEQILDGLVLTTRIGRRRDRLILDADLAAFSYQFDPDTTETEEPLEVAPDFERRTVWLGPPDWLADVPEGELATVWVDNGVVHVERAPEDVQTSVASADDELVRLLRGRFDVEIGEAGLPLSVRELVVAMRAEDATCFRRPAPPLSELCRAAGLEVRGTWVADRPERWARQRWGALLRRLFEEFEEPERKRATPLVLLLGHLGDGEEPGPDQRRTALEALADPALTLHLLRLLFGAKEDPAALADLAHLVEVLRPAATRPRQRAAVAWLGARVATRQGDPQRAEVLLRDVLVDDPHNPDAMDELAWYRSDRGDAEGARSLWLQLADPPPDIDALPAAEPAGPKLRRNEPCWCGSGRKYKVCHLRVADRAPLPDRFPWLLQKSMTFLQRRSGLAVVHLAEAAEIATDGAGEPDAIIRAWSDPLVVDVVLAEFGWLQRFLDERGALLPDDERLLVTSWLLAERTVVEVLAVDGPAGLVRVRDLRTGDEHEVFDAAFAPTARRSQLICTRLLDDGQRKRLGIGVLEVPPGHERGLLQILDLEDPQDRGEAVLSWSAAASAPPRLQTREGEPLMLCRARIGPVDPDEAYTLFDDIFEPGSDDDEWYELHELSPDESILRGTITVDGAEILVETNSEVRVDRLIHRLLDDFPGAVLLEDERRPMPPDRLGPTAGSRSSSGAAESSEAVREALGQIVDQQELRWCDENVPALDGLTPRQAAADPTRREQLERLLVSMPEGGVSPLGFATMRPARLREMLGLS